MNNETQMYSIRGIKQEQRIGEIQMANIWYEGNLNTLVNKRVYHELTYYIRGVLEVENKRYERYALQTHFIEQGEDYLALLRQYVCPLYREGDILSISEKVIAMCQGQTVHKSNIHLGLMAKCLSRFATQTKSGIGMDEPYKLQLVINLKGPIRVFIASIVGALGKCIGKRGWFYKLLGKDIAGIDGLYAHSAFEIYCDLAILQPKNPDLVCEEIYKTLHMSVMIVDANDISVDILGTSSDLKENKSELATMIKDNPAGQDDECTPFILIRNIYDQEAEKYVPLEECMMN